MRDALTDRPFPRATLVAASMVVVFALVAVGAARITGVGITPVPTAAAVESRELRFADRPDGAVLVLAGRSDEVVDVLAPGSNGFVRGVLRGLVRERKRRDIGDTEPFRLTRWADGRMSLLDPTTGREIGLEAFGPTNFGAFLGILNAAREARS